MIKSLISWIKKISNPNPIIKSTTIRLIECYYDKKSKTIMFDFGVTVNVDIDKHISLTDPQNNIVANFWWLHNGDKIEYGFKPKLYWSRKKINDYVSAMNNEKPLYTITLNKH